MASEGLESSLHAVSVDAALAVIEALEAQSEVRPLDRSKSEWALMPSSVLRRHIRGVVMQQCSDTMHLTSSELIWHLIVFQKAAMT